MAIQSSSSRLLLNNLVEFYMPISSKYVRVQCKSSDLNNRKQPSNGVTIEIEITVPCTVLAQRIDLQIDDMFSASEDFTQVFSIPKVMHMIENCSKDSQSAYQESILIKRREAGHPLNDAQSLTIYQDEDDEAELSPVESQPSQNSHSLRLCNIGSKFLIVLNVKEQFGLESNEANQYSSADKRGTLKEELRSISRTMIENDSIEESKEQPHSQPSVKEAQEIFHRAIMSIVKGVRLYGWPSFHIPASNQLIPLMNTRFVLEQKRFMHERRDLDFLIALSLISGRKFIQACEIFRRLQRELLSDTTLSPSTIIDKAVQLEILISDSLNQHQQLKEKIQAFQRAIELSLHKKLEPPSQSRRYLPMNDEEAHKVLMRIHPHLIKILLQNIDTHVEALKMAVLRNIEFLIDQLGCSLDSHLIHILVSVIKTYPRSNSQNQIAPQYLYHMTVPSRYGFFQEQHQNQLSHQSSTYLADVMYDKAFENSYLNSIVFDMNDITNIMIKDGLTLQNSYISCIKNLQNHILESFISLLSSMSSSILHQIFNEVILKCIFLQNASTNPFEMQLATDLRIYLLKFMDKIVTICQGDLILNSHFLNSMVECMYPGMQAEQKKSAFLGGNSLIQGKESVDLVNETLKLRQKANQTITLACSNLWATFTSKLFVNYSNKGLKILFEWIFNKLVTAAEAVEEQKLINTDSLSKLNLVFDLIQVITSNTRSSGLSDPQEDEQCDNNQIPRQSLSSRDMLRAAQRPGKQGDDANVSLHGLKSDRNSKQRNSKKGSLIELELYALINPLLFWLDYSIERPDRLSFFKVVWKTLTKLLNQLPQRRLEVDSVTIILPVLKKVNDFCQTSSPPLEMLQFLQVVLQDFIKYQSDSLRKKSKKRFVKFLNEFLITISKCIPHHLNEEIFIVCEQLLDLLLNLHQSESAFEISISVDIRESHISCIIDALTDKFTMRSKAHKRLSKYFMQRVIIEESMGQLKFEVVNPPEQARNHEDELPPIVRNDLLRELIPLADSIPMIHNENLHQHMHSNSHQMSQAYMSVNSGGGGAAAPQSHQRAGGSMRHNNNDLGLVVNTDDVELSRDFAHINHHQSNHYDYERDENAQFQMDNEGEEEDEGVDEEDGADEGAGGGAGMDNDGMSDVQDVEELEEAQRNYSSQNEHFQPRPHNQNNFEEEERIIGPALKVFVRTNFDIFTDISFIKQEVSFSSSTQNVDKHREILVYERFQEKLGLFIQLLKSLDDKQIPLFQRLLRRDQELHEAVMKIYSSSNQDDDQANFTSSAIEIVEILSKYFMTHCAPKNVYEHSAQSMLKAREHILTSGMNHDGLQHVAHQNTTYQQPHHNNNQNSQSSGHQQQFVNQGPASNPRVAAGYQDNAYFSSSHSIVFQANSNMPGNQLAHSRNMLRSTVHSQQHIPQAMFQNRSGHNQQLHHPNQLALTHNLMDDDFIMGTDIDDDQLIIDDIEVINSDRQILIKIFTGIIRVSIDKLQIQGGDVHSKFHTLNLIDNLFANLLPVPSLLNVVLSQSKPFQGGFQQHRARMMSAFSAGSDIGAFGSSLTQNSRQGLNQTEGYQYYDIEKQVIVEKTGNLRNQRSQARIQNPPEAPIQKVPIEFECTDQMYIEGRLNYSLKIWAFLEEALTKSSWSTIKSISYGVICQILRGVSLTHHKHNESRVLQKMKTVITPLLNQLLNSKESESKAGGLNILGSICGLGIDLGTSSYNRYFKVQDYLPLFRDDEQNKEHFILGGSRLISVSIWQRVFQLSEEDWDHTIRDAATVLIQICAPRSQIMQFQTIAKEKYQAKLSQMVNAFKIKRSSKFEELKQGSSDSESTSSEESDSDKEEHMRKYFYVDAFNDEQIRELLAIFKNDYKQPLKNLWVEKNGAIDGNAGSQGDNQASLVDVFEDRIVDRLNKLYQQQQAQNEGIHIDQASAISHVFDQYFFTKHINHQKDSSTQRKGSGGHESNVSGDSEYLIFERHFDDQKIVVKSDDDLIKKGDQNSSNSIDNASHEEDLGIIDLDELENQVVGGGSDSLAFFDDQFDDDKLPVLKNTYSKKHRPNNSKSVAVGSRTQNMLIMTTSNQVVPTQNQEKESIKDIVSDPEPSEQKAELLMDPEQNIGSQEECKVVSIIDSNRDKIIEAYEQRIAQSIAHLSSQLTDKSDAPPNAKTIEEHSTSPNVTVTKIQSGYSPNKILKSRTPKEDTLKNRHSSDSRYRLGNKSQEHIPELKDTEAHQHSLNIDHQQIYVTLTTPSSNALQKSSAAQQLFRKAMGQSEQISNKQAYASQAFKLKSAASQPKALVKTSAISMVESAGPLVASISSSRRNSYKFKNTPITTNHKVGVGLNLSYQPISSFASSVQNQKSQKKAAKKPALPPPTLMQQAKQAMVSRAKSQSYLNSTGIPMSNTPIIVGGDIHAVSASQLTGHSKTATKKKSNFKRPQQRSRGVSGTLAQQSYVQSMPAHQSLVFEGKNMNYRTIKPTSFLEQSVAKSLDIFPSSDGMQGSDDDIIDDTDEAHLVNVKTTGAFKMQEDEPEEDEDLEEFIRNDDGESNESQHMVQ